MKIAIDISAVLYGTGVSVYTKCLVENLLKLDKKNLYILFGGSLRRKEDLNKYINSLSGNYTSKLKSFPPALADILWNRLHLFRVEKMIGRVDVFHSSDWAQPPTEAYSVTTVHDLFPLRFPKLVHPKIASVHRSRVKWIIREVDKVIVPSMATRDDLRLLGVNLARIAVIPEACDPFFMQRPKEEEVKSVKKKFNLDKYVLSVGVGERKNTERIVKAMGEIGDDLQLVIVGRNLEGLETGDAIVTGFISNDDYRALLAGANALVYTSLYEGFGLPILKAFALGCPVVTSNLSSMPEVAGDAAILVDPYSVEDIAAGVVQSMKQVEKLNEKAKKQLHKFSWEANAVATLGIYESRN